MQEHIDNLQTYQLEIYLIMNKNNNIQNLLDLNGEKLFIDEKLGLWVKFEAQETFARESGVKYSLTLHDKSGERILGFDNAHQIEYGAKIKSLQKRHTIIAILMEKIKLYPMFLQMQLN